MNMNVAATNSATRLGSSALFTEGQQYRQVQIREQHALLSSLAVKSRLRSLTAKQAEPKTPYVDRQNPDGNAALHFASFDGELGQTRLLIAAGANVNIRNGRGDAPLTCAAYNGHCNVIMALVAAGAALEARDEDGRTALTWAVIRGQTDAVRLLISLGADVTVYDNVDNCPLLWAIIHNRREICELLVEAREQLKKR